MIKTSIRTKNIFNKTKYLKAVVTVHAKSAYPDFNTKNEILVHVKKITLCLIFPLLPRFVSATEKIQVTSEPASIHDVLLTTTSAKTNHSLQSSRSNKTVPCEPFVLHPPGDDEFVEITKNKSFDIKKAAEQEIPMDYDPYALADFYETACHPIENGLLVGHDEHGIPLIVTDRDLGTFTDEQLNDSIRRDPKFHEFREGFSSKRIRVAFPDFKLPPDVLERNSLPSPGEITTALLIVDDKQQPVYKQNGEKAMYFIRPLKETDLRAIQELEMREDDWAMNIERGKRIQEDPDETSVYDARLKARNSTDTYSRKDNGASVVKELEWPDTSTSQQPNFRKDIMSRMSYTQFWLLIRENRIEKVKLTDDNRALWVTTKRNAPGGAQTHKVGIPFDPQLPDHLMTHRVKIEESESNLGAKLILNITRIILPILLAVYIQKYLYNIGQPSKSSEDIFAKARLEKYHGQNSIGITFNDVAGADSIKEEMKEIIEFLRNPSRFINMGCRTPAGLLLAGPPGTGKTLMAKAVGGEAGVPFFSVAGTEFAEIYSGVGASRVRDMFEIARKNSPCILFIDEFDSIGKAREGGVMGGNDENVATINQLLTELDGFENNEGVLVMAATNRPTALDEALTRPGRFDRIITMGLPNNHARANIFKVHSSLHKVEDTVDWCLLARATSGFSGAEIMNVMNVAATLTVQANESLISQDRIFDAFEKVVMERSGKENVENEDSVDDAKVPLLVKRYVSVYLAAKSLLAFITPMYDEVIKISCCPSNQPNGRVFFVPQEEQLEPGLSGRSYLESRLVVLLAGRAAENLIFGAYGISGMGESDMTSAYFLARDMVFKHGFGRRVGPINLIKDEVDYLSTDETYDQIVGVDQLTATLGAHDIADLLAAAEAKAYYGLSINYQSLETLSSTLDQKRSIGSREIKQLMESNNVSYMPSPFLAGFTFDSELANLASTTVSTSDYVKEAIRRVKEKMKPPMVNPVNLQRESGSNTINICPAI